jgi:hypothetical protein
MKRFLHGMSDFGRTCRSDLTDFHTQERFLDDNYKAIKRQITDSMREPPPPKPLRASVPAMRPRRLPVAPIVPTAPAFADRKILVPAPFPLRHYALRPQPCRQAARIFRPKAQNAIWDDRFELIDDYLLWPTEHVASVLDGTIDPILHVGEFTPDDFKWRASVG